MEDKFKDGTFEIVGAAFKVHSALGQGLREKPYENALVIELRKFSEVVEQQRSFPIRYENSIVGECVPDITVDGRIVVEIKAIDEIGEREVGQLLNYLRISKLKVGLILNFKNASLEIKRVVL